MRPRFQILPIGSLIVMLIAALGFAAVSARESAPDPEPATSAELPAELSARVAAAGFASSFVTVEPEPPVVTAAIEASPAPRAEPDSSRSGAEATTTTAPPTTTTTTAPPPTTTTTTAPPPTTTTTTTTTTVPPTTTTTVPPTTTTTAPPTTTTQPPTTTTTTPPVEGGPRDVEEWRSLVGQYFPEERIDEALRVIRCESLGDPLAYNPSSGASGLFQFIPGTWGWASPNAGFAGASPFDPEANVATAAWLVQASIDQGKDPWLHWTCKP